MRGRDTLRNMFGLDWRSLALMRMGLAVTILADLAVSSRSLRAFYSDEGVLPVKLVRENFAPDLSLYLWHGSAAWAAVLFCIEAVLAVMMLAGYRTKLATLGVWVMLLCRQARNPMILFGADMTEHIAMFWAVLLPLNRRYSLDAYLGRVRPPEGTSYLSMTSFGAVLQYMVIYIVSGILKSGPTWHVEHSAVYYALSIQMYARPLGQWLNQHDTLTAWLTVATLYLELYGTVLFILPFVRGWGRLLGCAIFGGLQIVFGATMQMGLFWVAMDSFLLMLLPAEFWTWLAEPAGRWLAKKTGWKTSGPPPNAGPPPPRPELPRWRKYTNVAGRILGNLAMAGIIVYMLLINYDTIPGHAAVISNEWRRPTTDTGLEQYFNMFAPDPQTEDGWFLLHGTLKNGDMVDLRTGQPASFDEPASIADSMGDQRWCSYFLDIIYEDSAGYRPYYAEYLERNWDNTHPLGQQLARVEIIYMRALHGPNHTFAGPQPIVLWSEDF